MDHAGVDALLGAYVLDACDLREQDSVRTHVDDCEACRQTLATLYEAAGWLGVDASDTPPVTLRKKILDAAEKIE